MRVLVCPTAFKGSLGAARVAASMAAGARRVLPDARVVELPLSDGGPGLLDALRAIDSGASVEEVEVAGPLGRPTPGRILWWAGDATGRDPGAPPGADAPDDDRDVAVIESADACGIHLVAEEERDALRAHTRGVGQLIREAMVRGARRVVVGLGGSATTDGGTGMARVFGYRFLDPDGRELPPGGGPLRRLARIAAGRSPRVPVTALADVVTPMNGAGGAARTFGPQKGADADQLEKLVEGLERLSSRMDEDLDAPDVGDRPGSGAGGGLGAGLAAFLGAEIVPGSDWVLRTVGFRDALREADLVVTGEGAYDATSVEGKITGRVVELAREAGVPVVLLCGRVTGEPPEGVRVVDGGGRLLGPDDLADLSARAVHPEAPDGEDA